MALIPDIINKKATTDLGYQAKVVVGGKEPAKFVPNINASFQRKIENEFFININAPDVIVGNEIPTISDKPEIKIGDRTDRFYVTKENDLEYEIILDKKPATNQINLEIRCSPSLQFAHQPALTQEELDNECFRPDDIINSYAVYCGEKNNEYQTGKVCHIKRAFVTAKNHKTFWCEQIISVTKGVGSWLITLPYEIWDNGSLYPLVVGPTMGYDTAGGSEVGLSNYMGFGRFASDGAGTANPGTFYVYGKGSPSNAVFAVYEDVSGDIINADKLSTSDPVISLLVAPGWRSGSLTVTGLLASTDYWLLGSFADGGKPYYDTGPGYSDGGYVGRTYNGSCPDPFPASYSTYNNEYSFYLVYAAGGTAYTLTADSGSFSLIGTDASLERGSKVSAESGAFALTGQDAGLNKGRSLTAESGTLALSGTDAGLLYKPKVAAEAGIFSVAGTDANLEKGSKVSAEAGTFTLTGQDAGLNKGKRLAAEAGNFALSGADAGLLYKPKVAAEAGIFALTGQDASLVYSGGAAVLTAESGSFAITGQDVSLKRTGKLTAEFGTFVLAGQDSGLLKGCKLSAETAAFDITGNDAGLLRALLIDIESGAFILTGQDVSLSYSGAAVITDPAIESLTVERVLETLTTDKDIESLTTERTIREI